MTYQIKVTNTQSRHINVRKVLDDYTYTDKRTDLPHKLTLDERDSIARFFYQSWFPYVFFFVAAHTLFVPLERVLKFSKRTVKRVIC